MLLCCRDLWCCYYGVYTKGWVGFKEQRSSPVCECRQWRYVNLHTPLQQKTIQRRSACFENNKKHSKCAYQIDPMKSVQKNTTKREFSQILARKFCKIWLIQMCVSLERKRNNNKKTLFLRARFPVRRVFASSIPRNEMMTTYIMIYRYTLWKRKKTVLGLAFFTTSWKTCSTFW